MPLNVVNPEGPVRKRNGFWLGLLLCADAGAWSLGDLGEPYLGGGLGYNSYQGSGGDISQLFVGAEKPGERYKTGFELGYVEGGDTGAKGPWVSIHAIWPVEGYLRFTGRLGVDAGTDSGGLLGLGIGHWIERYMEVRVEYLARGQGDGVLFNMALYPERLKHP